VNGVVALFLMATKVEPKKLVTRAKVVFDKEIDKTRITKEFQGVHEWQWAKMMQNVESSADSPRNLR
jgi:hypothetical protein